VFVRVIIVVIEHSHGRYSPIGLSSQIPKINRFAAINWVRLGAGRNCGSPLQRRLRGNAAHAGGRGLESRRSAILHSMIPRNLFPGEIDQVLRSKELELSQVEIEVQSLRIVAELLGEEADQEEARKLAGAT